MDPTFTGPALQVSNDIDVDVAPPSYVYPSQGNVDGDGDGEGNNSGTLQNGFVSPPTITKDLGDLTLPESTPEESSIKSSTSPESSAMAEGRKAYLPTGLCYDDRMKLHANADWSGNPHHPEDPRRIEAIMKTFREAGLVSPGTMTELIAMLKISPQRYMWRITAREATEAEICTAHTASHFQWVRNLSIMSSEELRELTRELDSGRKSLYVGNLTYQAALISAGGAIETCKNVVAGKVKNAIAVIRPPGHHAEHNEPMGFCLFNNVPIAVKVCQADYPELCRKILILDWDVHHGNGIQNIFYDDPNVLYISIHVYDDGNFYPGRPENPGVPDGGPENCGVGAGLGRNVNIGWSKQGMGDGEYIAAFQRIVMPIAQEFDPDLVVISAGFDAATGDELGGCFVSPECYSHMTHMLMSLAGGKVAVCLEGGYNLSAISRSALAVAKTLMGEPPARLVVAPACKSASLVLHQVKQHQSRYWECMRSGIVRVDELAAQGAVRLHDAIRGYQRRLMSVEHTMVPLKIVHSKSSPSFDDQVLATPSIHSAKKIMLFIHDPPQFSAQPDPFDDTVHSHNAWVTDPVRPYINWAVKAGFGVIDVNIPFHITDPEGEDSYAPALPQSSATDPDSIENQCKELLCYLWDNYITGYDVKTIVIVGVGNAYIGAKQLLISRDSRHRIAGIVSFVTGTLRPIKSETDPLLSPWYKSHSLIWVAPDHSCWTDPESIKKVRKNRFGSVRQSEIDGIPGMMQAYRHASCSWIEEQVALHFSELGLGPGGEERSDETESEGEVGEVDS